MTYDQTLMNYTTGVLRRTSWNQDVKVLCLSVVNNQQMLLVGREVAANIDFWELSYV